MLFNNNYNYFENNIWKNIKISTNSIKKIYPDNILKGFMNF